MVRLKGRFGQRVRRLLRSERVIWLTTIGPDGTPQPRPVWFVWEKARGTLLIYSQPGAHKLKHLARNRRVAVHFNTDEEGAFVVVMTGTAQVERKATPAHRRADYLRKYRAAIRDLDMTPASFAQAYAVPIRVRLQRARGG